MPTVKILVLDVSDCTIFHTIPVHVIVPKLIQIGVIVLCREGMTLESGSCGMRSRCGD